jgi:anti-sigma regulatory factor (Ser/Thr protein kinase)
MVGRDRRASASETSSPSGDLEPRAGLERRRARRRHRERTVAQLSEAVSTLHRELEALKAENAELRAETRRAGPHPPLLAGPVRPMADGELVTVTLMLDVEAPACARSLVASCLRDRVAQSALESAQLLMSELVSNSLKHSGSGGDEVVVSVELTADWLRVGVLDSGADSVIPVRPADNEMGAGFGVTLVRMLSERWGVEHLAGGGTQVWAQLPRARATVMRRSEGLSVVR